MARTFSWREIEGKVSELRSESLDSIAETVLDLEDQIEKLTDQVERLNEHVADLEGEQ